MDLKESKNNTGNRHPWEKSRFLITEKLLAKSNGKDANFLDLGCGDLFFSKELCARNPKLQGFAVDIAFTDDFILQENSDSNINLTVLNSLDKLEHELNIPISRVYLMDVLEHIQDDKAFLRDVLQRPFITKETEFYITVPAFQGLFCSHDVFLDHYRRYNNKQLKKLLAESGLRVQQIGYFYNSLILPRLLTVIKEKVKKNDKPGHSELNHWNHGKLFTSMVRNVLMFDFQISRFLRKIGFKLPGLSNYAICKISV